MADKDPAFDVDGFLAASDLNSDHRAVVRQLFTHPSSENIEWRQVRSLLEALGAVTEEHDGKFKVTVGAETDVLQRPHGKDISKDTIVDLRHLLTRAGITGGSERSA